MKDFPLITFLTLTPLLGAVMLSGMKPGTSGSRA